MTGHTVTNPKDILSTDQLEKVRQGALEVLEETGVKMQHERALEILKEAGCNVNQEENRVRFPKDLVEENLEKVPSSFELKARDQKYDLSLGDPNLYFSPFTAMNYGDVDTGERRPATKQEYVEAIKLVDALDEVHWAIFPYVESMLEAESEDLKEMVKLTMRNTNKTSWSGVDLGYARLLGALQEVLGTEFLGSIAASPPLTWSEDQLDLLFHFTENEVPIQPSSGLSAGGTSPVTMAGALVQNLAEVMSVIVLAQIVNPGQKVIAQDYSQQMSMKNGQPLQGGIERGLLAMGWCQAWRSYDIPRMTIMSSDSKFPDYQCAMEKTMSVTLHALAGSNIISFMGSIYDELTWSPIVAIIDNDIAHMVARITEGIKVTEETLALDLINEVGPIPGNFLNKEHTRKWWKEEQVLPELSERSSYSEWEDKGRKDIIDRAKEKHEQILEEHSANPLTEEQNRKVEEILEGGELG